MHKTTSSSRETETAEQTKQLFPDENALHISQEVDEKACLEKYENNIGLVGEEVSLRKTTRCFPACKGSPWILIPTAFMVHFITSGVSYSIGLYYVTFLHVFKESNGLTAAIGSLNYATLCALGPLSSFLAEKFGLRTTVMCGGFLAGLGLLLSAFASNIYTLLMSYGLLTGAGYGLCFTCSVIAIGVNFDHGRTLAMGVAMSGVGCGNFCYPFLGQYLLDCYGWRGSLLITSGLTFNVIALGALMSKNICVDQRPTDSNENIVKPIDTDMEQKTGLQIWVTKLDVFKNYEYIIVHLNTVLFCLGLSVVFTHISAYAESLGLPFEEATSLISAQGICNLVGRVLLGVISHDSRVNVRVLHIVCYFMAGLAVLLCTVLTSYVGLMSSMCLFGLFSASYGPVLSEVTNLIVGVKRFSFGYGFMMISMATGTLIGAPTAGWLYDVTSIYAASMVLGGSTFICSSAVMLVPPVIKRLSRNCKSGYFYTQENLVKTSNLVF